jgi:hypothetical protein
MNTTGFSERYIQYVPILNTPSGRNRTLNTSTGYGPMARTPGSSLNFSGLSTGYGPMPRTPEQKRKTRKSKKSRKSYSPRSLYAKNKKIKSSRRHSI